MAGAEALVRWIHPQEGFIPPNRFIPIFERNGFILKLDADFFRGVDAQERGLLIVSEVIDLAKKLNMKIVAEGIESREQVDFLTE